MRQVYKRPDPPSTLAIKGYKDESVVRALCADQNGKCYLCERVIGTDFEVEHLQSQCHFPGRIHDWTNLFFACRYCNGKKQDHYDDILDPAVCPVETLIEQRYDEKLQKFVFISRATDPAVKRTISLLESVFNGANPKMRTLREERFLREFQDEFTAFLQKVADYQKTRSPDAHNALCEVLSKGQEYLGFKYWQLKDYHDLYNEFKECVGR